MNWQQKMNFWFESFFSRFNGFIRADWGPPFRELSITHYEYEKQDDHRQDQGKWFDVEAEDGRRGPQGERQNGQNDGRHKQGASGAGNVELIAEKTICIGLPINTVERTRSKDISTHQVQVSQQGEQREQTGGQKAGSVNILDRRLHTENGQLQRHDVGKDEQNDEVQRKRSSQRRDTGQCQQDAQGRERAEE